MSTLITFIQHSIKSLVTAIRQQKEINCNQSDKEEIQLSLFVDDMKLYIESPNVCTNKKKKLLELINEFHKVTG